MTTVPGGAETLYRITVENRGPSPATQVLVRELLPPDLRLVSVRLDVGRFDAATQIWHIGDLGVNESVGMDLIARVVLQPSEMQITNRVVVESFEPDANEDDNEDVFTIQPTEAIPTLGEWALLGLLLSMAAAAMMMNRRRIQGDRS